MYRIHRVLSVLFVLGICLVGGSYSAENSDCPPKTKRLIVMLFGQKDVDRFEQMFQDGKYDFSYHTNVCGANVLYYAAATGDLNRVQELVKHGAELINAKDSIGRSVLYPAARSGNLELVKWLVEKGLDVNVKDNGDKTVLHFAAQSGNVEAVKWFAEKGLDIHAKDSYDYTLLYYAARSGNMELVKWVINQGEQDVKNPKVLSGAVSSGNIELVQWLIEQGADLTDRDDLLYVATQRGDIKLVEYLVNQGVSVPNSDGALHGAVLSGNLELVQWLVEHGADVNGDYFNDSVLAYAVDSNYPEILRYLVEEAGVDVNDFINRKIDYTALEKAVKNNNFEFVKFLVEHGANINPRIILESYPLPYWYALGNADPEIVQYLRERDNLLKALGVLALIILAFSLFIIYKLLRRKTIRVE